MHNWHGKELCNVQLETLGVQAEEVEVWTDGDQRLHLATYVQHKERVQGYKVQAIHAYQVNVACEVTFMQRPIIMRVNYVTKIM